MYQDILREVIGRYGAVPAFDTVFHSEENGSDGFGIVWLQIRISDGGILFCSEVHTPDELAKVPDIKEEVKKLEDKKERIFFQKKLYVNEEEAKDILEFLLGSNTAIRRKWAASNIPDIQGLYDKFAYDRL